MGAAPFAFAPPPLPPGMITTNIGTMTNGGMEFSLNARLTTPASPGGLSWTANLVASTNRNDMHLNGPYRLIAGSGVQVIESGQPVDAFFVCRQAYAGGKPLEGQYYTLAGDSVIAGCDLAYNGRAYHDPSPRWIFGLTNALAYGRLDFGFTVRAWLGNYIYNSNAANLGSYSSIGPGVPYNVDASVLQTGFLNAQPLSDYYVQNGSFLRLDNLTIGYSFPWQRELVRVYVGVQNLLTVTGYRGPDPAAVPDGIDNYLYPPSRIITGGLTAQF